MEFFLGGKKCEKETNQQKNGNFVSCLAIVLYGMFFSPLIGDSSRGSHLEFSCHVSLVVFSLE